MSQAAHLSQKLELSVDQFLQAFLLELTRGRRVTETARETGLSREGIYKSLKAGGNPSFRTVKELLEANGFRLKIDVIPEGEK